MGRVVCSKGQSFKVRSKPEEAVCAFFWLNVSTAYRELPGATNSQTRWWDLVAEYSPVRHHDQPGRVRLAGSPLCHVISRFNTHCLECCSMGSPRRATPSLHLVTLTLHVRNSKKIFTEPHSAKSIFSRIIACNVVKNASIFPKTTQISCAGYRSIDRLMLSKIRTSYFPSSPSAASVIACARTRGQSVLPCQSSRGGVS